MAKNCAIVGVDQTRNCEDKSKEWYISLPENGQYLVITSVFYVVEHPKDFMRICKQIAKVGAEVS